MLPAPRHARIRAAAETLCRFRDVELGGKKHTRRAGGTHGIRPSQTGLSNAHLTVPFYCSHPQVQPCIGGPLPKGLTEGRLFRISTLARHRRAVHRFEERFTAVTAVRVSRESDQCGGRYGRRQVGGGLGGFSAKHHPTPPWSPWIWTNWHMAVTSGSTWHPLRATPALGL